MPKYPIRPRSAQEEQDEVLREPLKKLATREQLREIMAQNEQNGLGSSPPTSKPDTSLKPDPERLPTREEAMAILDEVRRANRTIPPASRISSKHDIVAQVMEEYGFSEEQALEEIRLWGG
jgi:hypothetical protein